MEIKVKLIVLLFVISCESMSSSLHEKVCKGVLFHDMTWSDLWDAVKERKLDECDIVNGSIQLRSIVTSKKKSYNNETNISFLNLREIRGVLKIFDLDGLISLNDLFPKLAVIRGESEQNSSSIIRNNRDLKEIGLTNLKHFSGNILIDNNPKLCFLNTINWNALKNDAVFMAENNENCPSCQNAEFCWNEKVSQVICDPSCLSGVCGLNGTCCSPECFGGCSTDPNDCDFCRNVSFNGICIQECPENTFSFEERFCVSQEECVNRTSKKNQILTTIQNEKCINLCPADFETLKLDESNSNITCADFKRKQICNNIVVNNEYWQHSGCQIVKGFVEIDLSLDVCDNAKLKTLSKTFSSIEVIHKYLKISGTKIRDLGFLKELKRIRGVELESNKFSLILENNENLRQIWLAGQNVSIDRGATKLTGNRKLCDGENCEEIVVNLSIVPNTYVAKIEWNSTKKLPTNLMYKIWQEEEFTEIQKSFCLTKNAKLIEETKNDTQIIYGLEVNTSYVYQMFDGNTQNLIGPTKYFKTSGEPFKIFHNLTTSSSITFHWGIEENDPEFINNNQLKNGRFKFLTAFSEYQIRAFRISPNQEYYEREYCLLSNNNSNDDQILQVSNFIGMRRDIKTFLENEFIIKRSNSQKSKKSIGREYIYKEVQARATSYTFLDVEHFANYFVSIRGCYNRTYCTSPTIFSVKTSANNEADQIENLFGKVVNKNSIELKWDSPRRPNGLVLTFTVHFETVGSNQSKMQCISYKQFIEDGAKIIFDQLPPGKYQFTVVVRSLAGYGTPSEPIYFEIKSSYLIYWIFSLFVLTLLVLFLIKRFRLLRNKRSIACKPDNPFKIELKNVGNLNEGILKNRQDDEMSLSLAVKTVNNETCFRDSINFLKDDFESRGLEVKTANVSKPDDDFELERENIECTFDETSKLGSGNSGVVYKGTLKDHEVIKNVAVKTVHKEALEEVSIKFLKEADLMKSFDTFHVIKLLGIVSKSKPYYIVMKFMTNGDLKTFLRKNRPQAPPSGNYSSLPLKFTVPPVSHMAIQIADGMAYLSHKKFVHRDLAARNCMVSDDLTVKIGDFGLTRDIYEADYYRKGTTGLLPLRWMSPESLRDGIFTSESDVFSYGIVLWEIVTYAEQPYKGKSNGEAMNFIIEGGTESRPDENCSDCIYETMEKCWRFDPQERITFNEIVEELLREAPENFKEKSFYCLSN